MKVAILGANGLIGSLLIDILIADETIETIFIVHYRKITIEHPKVKLIVTNFSRLEHLDLKEKVDTAYCCLGTTKKKTPDMKKYHQIDVEYPVSFANWFKKQGGKHYSVVSAVSANIDSSNYYNRFKGELEERLESLQLPYLSIMQPSLLLGARNERRLGEGVGKLLSPLLNVVMVGSLKKYRGIAADKVARKMFKVVVDQKDRVRRYVWIDFSNF